MVCAVSEALSLPTQSVSVPRYENCCCGPGPFQNFPGRARDQHRVKLCDGNRPFWLPVARDSATISATPAGLPPQSSSDEPPSPSSSGDPGQAGVSPSATRVAVGSGTWCSLAERLLWLACKGWVLEGTSSLRGWAWLCVAATPTPGLKGSCGDIIRKATLQAPQQIKLLPLPITAAVDTTSMPLAVCGEWPRNSSGVGRKSLCRHFWNMFPSFWVDVGFPSSFPSHLALTSSDGCGPSSPIQGQALSWLGGLGSWRKAVRSYGDCTRPIEVVEVPCHWRQCNKGQSQGGLIPQKAEKLSQMIMSPSIIKILSAFFNLSNVHPTYKFLFKYH